VKRQGEEKRIQEMIRCQQEEQKRLEEEQKRRRQEEQRRQLEAHWLKKYDFNGNGKLDLEEHQRAEADAKAGIQAPARDE
jgi:type II secretory pathway component PulJ